jgi:glycosyltransferase involved in cell wall biosynthesis
MCLSPYCTIGGTDLILMVIINMSRPKFTIITAGWRLEGVKSGIKSINNQTYDDWQHIIVNDNNPDLRVELAELCENEPRRHWIDIGVRCHYYGGFSRNVGAMIAFSYLKGRYRNYDNEWCLFLDDDNHFEPDHLQIIADEITANPKATFVGTDLLFKGCIDKEYSHRLKCRIKPQQTDLGSWAYKTNLFEKYGYFRPRPRHRITFDYELIENIGKGEAVNWEEVSEGGSDDKVRIIHQDNPTFHFYHKER